MNWKSNIPKCYSDIQPTLQKVSYLFRTFRRPLNVSQSFSALSVVNVTSGQTNFRQIVRIADRIDVGKDREQD